MLPLLALTTAVGFLSGCATTDFRVAHKPSREGSTSPLVRYAYFSTVMNAPPDRALDSQFPGGYREFYPDSDKQVVFVVAIYSPGRAFSLSGSLSRPDGDTFRRFHRLWSGGSRWHYTYWTFSMAELRSYPGEWKADLVVDGEPVGVFTFLLGDRHTIARIKREKTTPILDAPDGRDAERPAAVRLLRRDAEAGDGRAMAKLGFVHFAGRAGLQKDDLEAVSWFRKGAEAGDGLAMAFLGASYWTGLAGISRDAVEAVRWFRRGADAGDGRAMAMLGQAYMSGAGGLARDEAEAVRWIRNGAEAGDGRAMAMLGELHLSGAAELTKDDGAAERWIRKAADAGDGFAMATLGRMYETGEGGLRQDDVAAVKWYRSGAEAGSGRAMAALGGMYALGRGGLTRSETEAVRWYREGAALLDAVAMFELAQVYEAGRGVRQDRQQAAQWYRRSASLGSLDARDRLLALEESQ